MPVCCSCGKAEAGLGRTAGLSACDCGVPARRAVHGPAPGVELEPRARLQKELRAIALSRLVAPCPRDAGATSAVAQMTLRMQRCPFMRGNGGAVYCSFLESLEEFRCETPARFYPIALYNPHLLLVQKYWKHWCPPWCCCGQRGGCVL